MLATDFAADAIEGRPPFADPHGHRGGRKPFRSRGTESAQGALVSFSPQWGTMATKAKASKKRIRRPTKPPKAGERVPLGLRVTPEMKKRLERAAIRKGRSLSQEAEMRLERSLELGRHLVISRGEYWSPVFIANGELWVALGDDPRDASEPDHQETLISLKVEDEDL